MLVVYKECCLLLKRPWGRLVGPNYQRFVVSLLKAINQWWVIRHYCFMQFSFIWHGAREKLRLISEGVSWPWVFLKPLLAHRKHFLLMLHIYLKTTGFQVRPSSKKLTPWIRLKNTLECMAEQMKFKLKSSQTKFGFTVCHLEQVHNLYRYVLTNQNPKLCKDSRFFKKQSVSVWEVLKLGSLGKMKKLCKSLWISF